MAELLPPELWSHTFVLAADGDTIFYHGLPTSITQSSWVLTRFLGWQLKTPRDSINIVQRRGYATKKVRHVPKKSCLIVTPVLIDQRANHGAVSASSSSSAIYFAVPSRSSTLLLPFSLPTPHWGGGHALYNNSLSLRPWSLPR
jgi:hypothetical protein